MKKNNMKKLLLLIAMVLTICSTAMAEDGPANNEIWYTSSDGNVVTPSDDAFNVSIVSNDYKDGQGVITFDGELTSIGFCAFNNTSITEVTLPASLISIGEGAFGATKLTAVTIPASVTSIEKYAFSSCEDLTSLTFADGSHLETIGESAFNGTALSGTLNLPASLISIGEAAFATTKITAVTIPASVTSIEKYAFSSCSQLSSLTFADGSQLDTIKDEVFNKTAIEGVLTLPASLTSIGWAAFGATKITAVNFPASVTAIGQQAFDGCSNLATLNFADGSQLETIGIEAFRRTALSGNLDNLPASLKSIGVKAFSELAITAVTIPASVTTIEYMQTLMAVNIYNVIYDKVQRGEPIISYNGNDIYLDPAYEDKVLNYGRMGIHVGDFKDQYVLNADGTTKLDANGNPIHKPYMMEPNSNGTVSANASANAFKPYLGFGYGGRLIKNNDKYHISVDCGAMFWGGTADVVTHDGVNLTKDLINIRGDVDDYVQLAKRVKVFPVLNLRVSRTF